MKREAIVEELEAVRARVADYDLEDLTPESAEAMDSDLSRAEELTTQLDTFDATAARRAAIVERAAEQPTPLSGDGARPGPEVIRTVNPIDVLNDRSATGMQLADAVTRSLEDRGVDIERARPFLVARRSDTDWARSLLARSTQEYADAFTKYLSGRMELMTYEERAAFAVGTAADGGYLVPTHLDPTIILTNAGTTNAIRGISRVVTLTVGNEWNGVTSAGATAGWGTELGDATDANVAFAPKAIPLHPASSAFRVSFEALQDIANVGSDIMMLFADAKDRLEAAAHATGSGNGQPTGVFTALAAETNPSVSLISGTAADISASDLRRLYDAVPARWKPRSTFVMNPIWQLAVQALGTAVSASYTTDLSQRPVPQILGHNVVATDDAPEVVTTNAADQRIIFGDFSNYVIVDKPGTMGVRQVPVLTSSTNDLPYAASGWLLHWRTGADVVNPQAFRLLVDKTG